MVFSKSTTKSQLSGLYKQGLTQQEAYWNLGYSPLTSALPLLQNGLWFLISPENVGKSQLIVNIGYNILVNNPGAYWLDFSLDDSVEHRLSYLLARSGGISINLSKVAGGATEEEKAQRHKAFIDFNNLYGDRYSLKGVSSINDSNDMVYSVEGITQVVSEARGQIGPDAKLFITVDGFHDVDLEVRADDENSRLARKSLIFKRSATKDNALYLLTAHTRKDSRRRGITSDSLKGEGRVVYDATVVSHIYCDTNLNRKEADVYWLKEDEPNRLCPVLELDILKNKVGEFRDVIFLNALPEKCLAAEVDEATAAVYRGLIYGKSQNKK